MPETYRHEVGSITYLITMDGTYLTITGRDGEQGEARHSFRIGDRAGRLNLSAQDRVMLRVLFNDADSLPQPMGGRVKEVLYPLLNPASREPALA